MKRGMGLRWRTCTFVILHPPFLFPGANAARVPHVGVLAKSIFDAAGHRPQRVADQVGGAVENRELGTVAQKLVSHGKHCRGRAGITESGCARPSALIEDESFFCFLFSFNLFRQLPNLIVQLIDIFLLLF